MIAILARKYAEEQCRGSQNHLSGAFLDEHILPVASYALQIAERLGADREIVEIASYLHDISAVQDIRTLPEHPQCSAAIAASLLANWGYPASRIEQVEKCILTHSSPLQLGSGSLEDVCLSNADAMAFITRIPYWLFFAYSVRRFDFREGKQWLRERVERNWNALIEPAQEIIKAEYAGAVDCLK